MYARLIRAISVARKILRSVEYDACMKYYTPIQDLDYIRNQLLAWAIKFRLMCVVYIRDDKKFKQNVPRMKKFQYCAQSHVEKLGYLTTMNYTDLVLMFCLLRNAKILNGINSALS